MACSGVLTLENEVTNFAVSGNGPISQQADELGMKVNDFLTQKLREQNQCMVYCIVNFKSKLALDEVNLDEEEATAEPEQQQQTKPSKKTKKQKR
jgi:hypothetical protein